MGTSFSKGETKNFPIEAQSNQDPGKQIWGNQTKRRRNPFWRKMFNKK